MRSKTSPKERNCISDFFMKGALLILASGFTMFISYAYLTWFVLPYLILGQTQMNQQPDKQLISYGYSLLVIHYLLVFMLLWSLFKTW